MRVRPPLLAVAAGLTLADASIVTLALPDLLVELETTVEGVAAVIGVYTVVLAAALIPFERAARTYGVRLVGTAGFALFAVASAACAGADDITGLLIARAAQALGGAAGLATTFELLGGAGAGRRLWLGAAVIATALGPALGGALTQAFDWRAIFVFQAPVAAAAALAVATGPRTAPAVEEPDSPLPWRPAVALALVSAALSAVLFLLVLLLVAGWSVEPLSAAIAVSVIPVAAAAGARIGGDPRTRAVAGCALSGGGVLALAWLPEAGLEWTIIPQALAGVGMGLAFTALGGGLLPERTPRDAARLLAIRHAGIALILAVLAPVAADELDGATRLARERGVALVLDAPLAPQAKLQLAPSLLEGVESDDPRGGLERAVAAQRRRLDGSDRAVFDGIARRADDTLVIAIGEAFRLSFVVAGLLGFIAALLLVSAPPPLRRVAAGLAGAGALALLVPVLYGVAYRSAAPEPVAIQDPCNAQRELPDTGGVTGFLQDRALELLDDLACRYGSTREELVLALADESEARAFKEAHGVDPRSAAGILQGLLG